LELGGDNPQEGDKALASLLLLHSMVMNGGIDHAVEVLSPLEFSAALLGFRYFGLVQVAELLEGIGESVTEAQAEKLHKEYAVAVPSDGTLAHAFRLKLLATPEAFAPVEA
jgi:hypothetical protein